MPLTTSTPQSIFQGVTSAITALYTRRNPSQSPLNFTSGSMLGAIANAVVAWLFFLQQQIAYVYSVTRAGTSTGADLTSWGADYGLNPTRVAPTYANNVGNPSYVTLISNTPLGAQAILPASAPATSSNGVATPPTGNGVVIQDGSVPPASPLQFVLIADPANPNYNAGMGGYVAPAGATSLTVTVQALAGGTAGNAVAGTLQKIVTPGVPFSSVTQSNDILNGQNQETDIALRARQLTYVGALASSSRPALIGRITALQPALTLAFQESQPAFTVYVDDGSGAIPAITIANVQTVINANRAAGTGAATAAAPANQTITVSVTGTTAQSGFNILTVRAAIQAAIIAYINANGVGGANASNSYGYATGAYAPPNTLPYAGIVSVVASFIGLNVGQGLAGYSAITVNSGTSNVAITNAQLARATTGSVTVA